MRDKYSLIKDKYNTEILGISVDSTDDTREFQEKLDLPFPLLSDEGRRVIEAYNVSDTTKKSGKIISLSANVVINQKGDIIYYHKGNYTERPSENEMIEVLKKVLILSDSSTAQY